MIWDIVCNFMRLSWLHFNKENCKTAKTPSKAVLDLSKDTCSVLTEETPCWQFIGALLHLAITVRLDIAFAVNHSSQFMHRPTTQLWKAEKTVPCYLKQCSNLGLYLRSGGTDVFEAYTDADCGQELPSWKSIRGNLLMCAGSLVCWKSKKQSVGARARKKRRSFLRQRVFERYFGSRNFWSHSVVYLVNQQCPIYLGSQLGKITKSASQMPSILSCLNFKNTGI